MSGRIGQWPQSSKAQEGRRRQEGGVSKSISTNLIAALRRMRNHMLQKLSSSHGGRRKEADMGQSQIRDPGLQHGGNSNSYLAGLYNMNLYKPPRCCSHCDSSTV